LIILILDKEFLNVFDRLLINFNRIIY
jgi:hypothetical protein